MAKPKTPTIVLFAILFVIILGVGGFTGIFNLGWISGGIGSITGINLGAVTGTATFTPYYCNNFDYICCGNRETTQTTVTLTPNQAFTCKDIQCKITDATERTYYATLTSTATTKEIYLIKNASNCRFQTDFFGTAIYYYCDSGSYETIGSFPKTIYNGQKIYTSQPIGTFVQTPTSRTISYTKVGEQLMYCGGSPCPSDAKGITGLSILTSAGCSYVTDKSIYDTSEKLIKSSETSVSTTIPSGQCYLVENPSKRSICGNIEEECKTDADCPQQTICSSLTLQKYGCVESNVQVCSEYNLIGDNKVCKQYVNQKRCELKTGSRVQCCPGTSDCGSTAACDAITNTCKATGEVSCKQDIDCGRFERYDQEKKSIVKPVCLNPGTTTSSCSFNVVKSVECYYDTECPINYSCDADYKCKQTVVTKQQCPNECCVNKEGYYDKPAPTDKYCCSDGTVKNTQNDCGKDSCTVECKAPTELNLENCKCEIECEEGEHWVTEKTPIWWGLLGESEKGYCEKDTDYFLIALIVITALSLISLAIIFRKGPAKNVPVIKQVGEGVSPVTDPFVGRGRK